MAAGRHLAAVPDPPKRAVLYVRVSALMGREEGGDDFHSPGIQVEAARRLVESAGLREVAVIDDDIDVSGTTFSRQGLDKIRDMVEARQVDVVALHDLSRLGRDLLESLKFIRWLRDRGVTVLSAQERIDDSPEGQYFLQQFLGMAELRARQIGRGWANVIARRRREGKYHGPIPPTGLLFGDDGRLVHHPAQASAVLRAFRAVAAGTSRGAARRQLSADCGLKLDPRTFNKLLRNPVYIGQVGEKANAHKPLVDRKTWKKVQARLDREATTAPRVLEARYAISGLVRCGSCNGRATVTGSKGGIARVRCATKAEVRDPAKTCEGCGGLTLEAVEEAVLAGVAEYVKLLRHDVGASAARLASADRANIDASAVERELDHIQRAMVKLADGWGRGRVPDSVYEETMRRYVDSATALKAQLAELGQVAVPLPVSEVIKLGDHLVELWPRLEPHERNAVLRKLVRVVVVQPAGFWRQPAGERVQIDWL